MKNFRSALLAAALSLVVAAGSATAAQATTKIRVGASPTPHAEILKVANDVLKPQGYELQIIEYSDYVQPNMALEGKELDANFFQHKPYLDDFNKEKGTKLVSIGTVHYEPFGIYAGKTKSLGALKDGAMVAVPNDTTNEARALVGIFLNDQYVKGKAKKLTKDVETPKQAAVLGAGIMGGGIAYQSAWKGVPVVMKDINDKSLTLGMTEAAKLLNKQLERGKIDGLKLAGVISTIHPTLDYAGFDRVDIVVEAVVENPKVKKAVLAETEQKVRPDTVLASNTSTIPISELANALERPENFCGMHFFNPVHRMPLVEIIRGEKSSDETIAKVVAWASKMGKTPIVVNDCPGFFVNRVLFPYFAGFSQLLRDGADFRKIDKVMEKQFGWPMGPAYLLDVVGIDTAHHAQAVMAAGFPQRMQKDYRDAIDALFDANRFGQKNGLGFWRYKEDSKGKPKKEEDAAVEDLLAEVSQPKRDFSEEEIIARMMIPMVNEVVRCLEEGIIATPAEADMALVYGLGFPPFHGGAFRWLDTLGSAKYLDMAQQYQHLGPLYEVPEGLRNKARHNEPYYPPVEPARPVGDLKTA